MYEQIQNRIEALKKEYATGQERVRQLETEVIRVRETMLRITGAVQALEEVLSQLKQDEENIQA